MRVLHLEDDSRDADLVGRELARTAPHVQITVARTVQEARNLLEAGVDWDLVLADSCLPDGSGLELLREIRDKSLNVAFILLAGRRDEKTAVAAFKGGSDDYLAKRKGFQKRLPQAIDKAHRRHQAERARRARPLRVLYGEGKSSDIDLTQRHFQYFAPHFRLEVVRSGDEALARLSATREPSTTVDVLLLDYDVPGLSALEILRKLACPPHLGIPVVLLSGSSDQGIAARVLRLGASDFLV